MSFYFTLTDYVINLFKIDVSTLTTFELLSVRNELFLIAIIGLWFLLWVVYRMVIYPILGGM